MMDIVERLRVSAEFKNRNDKLDSPNIIHEAANEIERLREALRFYANRKHYDLFVRSHTSMGEYETSHILDDAGSIAREALGEK